MATTPKKTTISERPRFILQWHVTAKCNLSCAHCYIGQQSEAYLQELNNELDFTTCVEIIDDFAETFHSWGMPTKINFTGGDPLLKKEIFDLIRYAKAKGIKVGILGNSNRLDGATALQLKECGLDTYQMSIDGGEETHDRLRGQKGLFRDTIRAIHILKDVRIRSVIMFTLHKLNAHELIDVINLVAKQGISIFDFSRLVPLGSGKEMADQLLTPKEYRALLLKVFDAYRILKEQGCRTRFGRKDNLWKLLYQELGLLNTSSTNSDMIYAGCAIGSTILTVLADGRVLACRRLPVDIGRMPEQSFKEIFLHSEKLNQMREVEQMQKCGKCDLLSYCRGCPAVPHALYGDYFAPDPQCWKEVS